MTDRVQEVIAGISRGETRVDLQNCGIGDDALKTLVDALLPHAERVHFLGLQYCELTEVAGETIAKLILHPECALVCLDVCGNSLRDEGILSICRALHENSTLQELLTFDNGISAIGDNHILQMAKVHPALTYVDLQFTPSISDRSIQNNIRSVVSDRAAKAAADGSSGAVAYGVPADVAALLSSISPDSLTNMNEFSPPRFHSEGDVEKSLAAILDLSDQIAAGAHLTSGTTPAHATHHDDVSDRASDDGDDDDDPVIDCGDSDSASDAPPALVSASPSPAPKRLEGKASPSAPSSPAHPASPATQTIGSAAAAEAAAAAAAVRRPCFDALLASVYALADGDTDPIIHRAGSAAAARAATAAAAHRESVTHGARVGGAAVSLPHSADAETRVRMLAIQLGWREGVGGGKVAAFATYTHAARGAMLNFHVVRPLLEAAWAAEGEGADVGAAVAAAKASLGLSPHSDVPLSGFAARSFEGKVAFFARLPDPLKTVVLNDLRELVAAATAAAATMPAPKAAASPQKASAAKPPQAAHAGTPPRATPTKAAPSAVAATPPQQTPQRDTIGVTATQGRARNHQRKRRGRGRRTVNGATAEAGGADDAAPHTQLGGAPRRHRRRAGNAARSGTPQGQRRAIPADELSPNTIFRLLATP